MADDPDALIRRDWIERRAANLGAVGVHDGEVARGQWAAPAEEGEPRRSSLRSIRHGLKS